MEKSKNLIAKATSFFYKDFHWKMLSLALAFVLWFVGSNVNNPVQPVTYDNLPIVVLHRDQLTINNAMLLNEQQVNNTRISASIWATRSNHALIQAARNDNVQASIDLSTVDFDQIFENGGPVSVFVDVDVFIHQEYISRTMRPYVVELILDRHGDLTLPVNVDLQGIPQEGFESRTPVLTHSLVRITGARSVLDEISEVRVEVYIDDAYETVEGVYPLMVYNNQGEDITSTVNLSIQTVHVRIPIFPYANIPLVVNTTGTVMTGFMVTEIIIDPPVVSLIGSAEEIEETSSIILGDIDIDSINQTLERTFDIRQALIGTGLVLRGSDPSEAVVTIAVEQIISRELRVPLGSLSVRGYSHAFSFASQSPISISLRGRESIIDALNLNQITAILDLTGLGEGTHHVPVSIIVPSEVTLVNQVSISVIIEPEPTVPSDPEEAPDLTEGLHEEDTVEGEETNTVENNENEENNENTENGAHEGNNATVGSNEVENGEDNLEDEG